MSTPCWDTASDDPRDLNEPWRGTGHASSEWEMVEPTCGPEFRLDWTGFYASPRYADHQTFALPFGGRWYRETDPC